jgi:glycosyltransferase involved in cell wall biosynthesis
MLKVIISNGHFKFILGPAAAEANKRKILDGYITAGYPTTRVKQWISFLGLTRYGFIKRLLNREELIPEPLVHPLWLSEIIIQVSAAIRKITKTTKHSEWLDDYGLRLYGRQASRIIRGSSAKIYHYRSGYGHDSVKVAKQKGMIVVCDHSIAHPAACEFLVGNQGKLPLKGQAGSISKFWSSILKDIDQSEDVIVNSDFVKDTFTHQGWASDRIHVVYTGIDNEFLKAVPCRSYDATGRQPLKLLFAGELGSRKGGEFLIQALQRINDLPWQLEIIGSIDPAIKHRFDSFLSDSRVTISGFLPRLQLAEHMSKADVFIFPSLAEGSARVIFMAMACGCYVITTPNSGSIVKDGIHGSLVPPGEVDALEKSIRQTLMKGRNEIARIGKNNAEVIRKNYTQDQYGKNLFNVYERLLTKANSPHE